MSTDKGYELITKGTLGPHFYFMVFFAIKIYIFDWST